MKLYPFCGNFTQQEPISEEDIAAALDVLGSGRPHRYNTVGSESSQVSLLEQDTPPSKVPGTVLPVLQGDMLCTSHFALPDCIRGNWS